MIYKIKTTGYLIVEADDPKEAREKAEDEDFIEKFESLGRPEEIDWEGWG